MKKIIRVTLLATSLLTLVACSSKHDAQTTNSSSSSSVSSSAKDEKDNGQKSFETVLERYKTYEAAINSKDDNRVSDALKGIDAASEEFLLIENYRRSESTVHFQSAFVDLDKDGVDELLIGNQEFISAIYHLKDNQPTLLHSAYVAPVGGFRSALTAYENGQVAYAAWQASTNPEMNLFLYQFETSKPNQEKDVTTQLNDGQKVEDVLGVTAKTLDLKKIKWRDVVDETSDSSQETQSQPSSSSQSQSEASFQVRVSVSDLKIRQEPTTGSDDVGNIAQGVHTITETRAADGYTWGKLESGQGWIALDFTQRVDENASTPAVSSGMNLQEIQNGNFSSIAGTWRNAQGKTVTFDANGISQVNGHSAGSMVFEKFQMKGDSLMAVTRGTEAISETPILFTPNGQDGRESIFWSKEHVSDGTDILYRD